LDEPSQYLDAHRKKVLLNYLEKLSRDGKALLVVEHNLEWLPSGWKAQQLVVKDDVLKRGDEWTI
jgi:energy-coupling factor transporter ATP-binding protein EcfA2